MVLRTHLHAWGLVLLMGAILAGCGGGGGGDTPPAGSAIYDAFSSTNLDGTKWTVPSHTRAIVAGKLRLSTSTQNMVDARSYFNRIAAIPSAPVTSLSADVTVVSASRSGTGSQARASVELRFQAPDYRGIGQDLFGVRVELREDGTGLRSTAYLYACANADCTDFYTVAGPTGFSGTFPYASANIGQAYNLSVSFSGSTITVGLDGATSTLDASVYPWFDPAHFSSARVNVQGRQDPGTQGGAAAITADFDNVMINGGLHDDFATTNLDATKWASGESSAQIVSGVLELSQRQAERVRSNSIPILNPAPVRALTADVTVTEWTSGGTAVVPQARLAGTFFHEGNLGDLGGGHNGDIWAQVYLTDVDAKWAVVRCLNREDCNAYDLLAEGTLNLLSLTLGDTYSLSIEWDGTELRFKVSGYTAQTWDPVVDGGLTIVNANPSFPHLVVGTRIGGTVNGGEYGTISATIDNVQVANRGSTAGAVSNRMLDAFEGLGALLDQHRWNACEFDTSIATGISATNELHLEMACGNLKAGQSYSHWAYAVPGGTLQAVQADMVVLSGNTLAQGGHQRTMAGMAFQPTQYSGWSNQDWAEARVELRDFGGGLTARGLVYICNDDSCTNVTASVTPDSGTFTPNLPVSYDTTYTATVSYDAASNNFTMTLSDGVTSVTGTWSTAFLGPKFDETAPTRSRMGVRVVAGSADGYMGHAIAEFDNVQFDTGGGLASHDTFEGGPNVDTSKWSLGDSSRKLLGDGLMTVRLRQGDTQNSVLASVDAPNGAWAIWTDTTITNYVAPVTGALNDPVPQSMVLGSFFSDGNVGDGYGGRNGDVRAGVALRDTTAVWFLGRCVTAACRDLEVIATGDVTGATTLALSTTYRIGVQWSGSAFRFYILEPGGVLDSMVTVDPVVDHGMTIANPSPFDNYVSVGARMSSEDTAVDASITGVGDITATFDNVVVGFLR